MEFKFNVNDVFKQPIVEINNNLIPPGFSGDRRALWDSLAKITEIVNTMGEASAAAQGLSKPITTADRLRNSEHKLYLLIDQSANNGKGAVTGMLKTGRKGLYVFDKNGQHYQVTPPCVLDFYVHESRQRNGLGKQLFEHMLQKEEIQPVKMAIDRPSEKLLGFLNKHYTLNSPVKQMNNYVVFDGFFPKSEETGNSTVEKKVSANGLQKFSMPQGRYGAPRPPCSMGQIIHNQTTNQEPTGVKSLPATNYQGNPNGDTQDDDELHFSSKLERPQSLSIQKSEDEKWEVISDIKDPKNMENSLESNLENNLKAVKINENISEELPPSEADGTPSAIASNHLTNQGYFDIKFYHSKLW